MTAAVAGWEALASPVAEHFAAALRGEPCELVGLGAAPLPLPVRLWAAPASAADRAVLAHCRGATLDIGCGPGRMSAHLAELGLPVGGIDVVPDAVALTRDRGVQAWQADVFGHVPREGTWETALLADGNIGIGGHPVGLLRRVSTLLVQGGRVVADLAPYGVGLRRRSVRLRTRTGTSPAFDWAVVGADAVGAVAEQAGLTLLERHEYAGRWCAVLEVTR